jgi:hypothetical protein
MSQLYKTGGGSGPIPPTVATSYVTDVNSPAIPAANVLNVPGGQTITNNDHGVQTDGSSGSNTLTVQLSNRATGIVTTADATLTTIITFSLGATPSTFYVYGNVQAFNSSTPSSAAYSFSGGYRTDGATATELGTEFHDTFQDATLSTSDIFLNVSGNDVLVQVQGVVALSINWNALLEFRKVS